MIFLDYRDLLWILIGILPLGFGVWLLWFTRKGKFVPSLFVRLIGLGVAGFGGLWVTAAVVWSLNADRSSLVFSPDHSKAFRVTEAASMSPRSTVIVDLYSHHGLVVDRIFDSGLNLVDSVEVHWINDAQAEVSVSGEGGYVREKQESGQVKIRWK